MSPGRVLVGSGMVVAIGLAGFLGGASAAGPIAEAPPVQPILFFVDASAEDPARALARLFGDRHEGMTVTVRADASDRLARDILVGGARADILLFADETSMDPLEEAELLDRPSRRDLLENDLVVIGSEEGVEYLRSPADLAAADAGAVALCDSLDPLAVYARAFLGAAGVWEAVAKRAYFVSDARAARAAVETGAADYAVVFGSQVRNAKWIRVVWRVAPDAHPPIRYPLALLLHGSRRPEVREFHRFLLSEAAAQTFATHGFHLVAKPHALAGADSGAAESESTAAIK